MQCKFGLPAKNKLELYKELKPEDTRILNIENKKQQQKDN